MILIAGCFHLRQQRLQPAEGSFTFRLSKDRAYLAELTGTLPDALAASSSRFTNADGKSYALIIS